VTGLKESRICEDMRNRSAFAFSAMSNCCPVYISTRGAPVSVSPLAAAVPTSESPPAASGTPASDYLAREFPGVSPTSRGRVICAHRDTCTFPAG